MERQTFVEIVDIKADIHLVKIQSISLVAQEIGWSAEEKKILRNKLRLKHDSATPLRIIFSGPDQTGDILLVAEINRDFLELLTSTGFINFETGMERVYINPSKVEFVTYNVSNPWKDGGVYYDFKRDWMYRVIMSLPQKHYFREIMPVMSYGEFKSLLLNSNHAIVDNNSLEMKMLLKKNDNVMVFSLTKQKWLTKKWDAVKDGFKQDIPEDFDWEKHYNNWLDKKNGTVKES